MFSILEWTKKDLMQFLKQLHKEGGAKLSKINSQISKNFKNSQN